MHHLSTQHDFIRTDRVDIQSTYIQPHIKEKFYYYSKRTIDIFAVLVSIVPLGLLLIVLGLLIKLDSRGPILFKQDRVGVRRRRKNGVVDWEIENFQCYKFRTMVHNADESLHQQHIQAFVQGKLKIDPELGNKLIDDPRITRIGHLLRKSSLDELPQLLNVLKGDMSLVGPRPVPTYEVAEYEPYHYERLAALPGITGLWQIYGRGNDTFEEMMRKDIEYVRHRSFWLDLKLLLLTVPAVLTGRGAN